MTSENPARRRVLLGFAVALLLIPTTPVEADRAPTVHEVRSLLEGTWELVEWHVGDSIVKPPQAVGLWSLHDGVALLSARREQDGAIVWLDGRGTYTVDDRGFRYGYDPLVTITAVPGVPATTSERTQPDVSAFAVRREPGMLVLDNEDGRTAIVVTADSLTYEADQQIVRSYRRVGLRMARTAPDPLPYGSGAVEERGVLELTVGGEPAVKRYTLRYPATPDAWNGMLVVGVHGGTGGEALSVDGTVTGTDELSLDDVIGEHAMNQGFAYASVDRDGVGSSKAGVEIVARFTNRMRDRLEAVAGRRVGRTYLVGLSMGGGITRLAAEDSASSYDGVVIIAGSAGDLPTRLERSAKSAALWDEVDPRIDAPLPDDDPKVQAYSAIVGTPPGGRVFWPFTGRSANFQNLRRTLEGYGLTGLSEDDLRSFTVEDHLANETFANRIHSENTTGRVRIPTIEVVGTHDDLVIREIRAYRDKVEGVSATEPSPTPADQHRLYQVEGVWHISGDDDATESFQFIAGRMQLGSAIQQAMAASPSYLPAVRDALALLDRWVSEGVAPPPNHTVAADAGLAR